MRHQLALGLLLSLFSALLQRQIEISRYLAMCVSECMGCFLLRRWLKEGLLET